MSMITKLVEMLKDLYVDPELDMLCGVDGECRQAIKESAQVIKELSAKLQAAKSQYYNGGWIPVSERLPEETGKCIVTAFDGVKSRSTYAHFQKTVGNFILTGRRSTWRVTAWMPLPEPYSKGE